MKTTTKPRKRAKDARKSSVSAMTAAKRRAFPAVVPGDLSPARQAEQDAEHAANHIRNSKLYGRMESDIYDLAHQASATRLLLDEYLDEIEGLQKFPKATAAELIHRTQTQAEVIDYMVAQLNRMAQALRALYTDGDAKAAA